VRQPEGTKCAQPRFRPHWPEVAERIKGNPSIFIPCGATEQHGPHLPLGVDVCLSTSMPRRRAHFCRRLVAPALAYGYKSMPRSGGGPSFRGRSISTVTHSAPSSANIAANGTATAFELVFFDGHFENQWFITEGIDLAVRELREPTFRVMRLQYWIFH